MQETCVERTASISFDVNNRQRHKDRGRRRTHAHHLLELLLINLSILVLITSLDELQQVINEVGFDSRAISESINSSQWSAEYSKMSVDFEGMLVILIG